VRFAAAFIDVILLGIVDEILRILVGMGGGSGLGLLVSVGYYTALEGGPTGQTVGKRVLGIRVIDFGGGGSIGYGRGFIRWLGKIVSAIPVFLGYFWMLWDKESQCWQDKLANSVVVPVSAYPTGPS
jgi:uncharacterized RDD family membrane protein YckC